MRNEEVVRGFRDGITCHSEHLYSEYNKLYSYNTCIAQKINNKIWANETKYSTTTSRHQSLVRTICNPYKIQCEKIPINTVDLNKYIK